MEVAPDWGEDSERSESEKSSRALEGDDSSEPSAKRARMPSDDGLPSFNSDKSGDELGAAELDPVGENRIEDEEMPEVRPRIRTPPWGRGCENAGVPSWRPASLPFVFKQ